LESKLIINGTISDADKGACFLTADLKDHFLASPMKNNEFMRIKYKYFPEAIRKQCNPDRFVSSDGYVCIRIRKGMCGLKQAAILACKHLGLSINLRCAAATLAPAPRVSGNTTLVLQNFASVLTILV
jgi:hypothetical protein